MFSIPKMEAAISSETTLLFYQSTRWHIPEHSWQSPVVPFAYDFGVAFLCYVDIFLFMERIFLLHVDLMCPFADKKRRR
jgi:hypothetical protein